MMQATIAMTQQGQMTQEAEVLTTYAKTKDGVITLNAKGSNAQALLNNPGAKMVVMGKATLARGTVSIYVQQLEIFAPQQPLSQPIIENDRELEETKMQISVMEQELARVYDQISDLEVESAKIARVKDGLKAINIKMTKKSMMEIVNNLQANLDKY